MEYTELKFISDIEDIRIDQYLKSVSDSLSRTYIQKLIKDGCVMINGKNINKSSFTVNEDDEIILNLPNPLPLEILPQDIPLDIIYEDNDFLIVNKPKGMVVHPAPGHLNDTMVNALLYHCKDSLSGINGIMRPGIVHRIDMDTTGSIIVCKNDAAHQKIAAQLKEHSINRIYVGIVQGIIKESEGTIDMYIARDKNDRKKMGITDSLHGKRAVTHYKVLEQFKEYSFVEFKLETGRTHQIRLAMSSIHHPLLGDYVYGTDKNKFKIKGQLLHAKTIGFIHPTSNEYVEYSAKLPDEFNNVLDSLRKGV